MCAIQNFHIDWIIDQERPEIEHADPNDFGRLEGNNLFLKSEEITYLTKKNVILYRNRLNKLQKDKKYHHLA